MSKHNRNRRQKAADSLPPLNRVPQGLVGRGMFRVTEYGVGSWCPTPDGSGPATAVVFHLKVSDLNGREMELGLRMHSAAKVDELIAMLERHRNDVWPGG